MVWPVSVLMAVVLMAAGCGGGDGSGSGDGGSDGGDSSIGGDGTGVPLADRIILDGVASDDPAIFMAEIENRKASAEPGRIVGFVALGESASSGPPSSPTQPVCVGASDFITVTPGAVVSALTTAGDQVATSILRGSAYDGHVGCSMWFTLDLASSDERIQLDIAGLQLSDAVDPEELDASGWVLHIWATPEALAANCVQAGPTTCALLEP